LDKSTASRVVDALERKGYVERTRHPDDGRALLIQATVAGSRLAVRIRAQGAALDGGVDRAVGRSGIGRPRLTRRKVLQYRFTRGFVVPNGGRK
jgi:DNA-binding MarR family transcriptional regulator